MRTCSGPSLWMDSTLVYFCVFFVCFHFWLVISYSTLCPSQQDNNSNRIGQWTNISSTTWILQLSHQLNPEAQVGMYTLRAFIGDRMFSQVFEVKKYGKSPHDV